MPVEINPTEDDIAYAERILLKEGQTFDDERRDFIKNLETIDLQAVPGSGKTTALLAKLLILEKHLPLEDGSGILVLSHTNVAVDGIKQKLEKHCPKLFAYPNFVGTIQSFINGFLAIPYYILLAKCKHYRIDNEIYFEAFNKFPNTFLVGFDRSDENNAKRYLHLKPQAIQIGLARYRDDYIPVNISDGKRLVLKKPGKNAKYYKDWTEIEKNSIEKWIVRFKKRLLSNGYLCFNDAYFLADEYIIEFPLIRPLLQKRNKYVFVDEMQDMKQHQYDILEDIFYDNGNSKSIYQRIGDKNQAIFDGDASLKKIWKDRDTVLHFHGSVRLNPQIASVVEIFGLEYIEIEGRRKHKNGDQIEIKPHLIVFKSDTISKVIPTYAEIIHGLMKTNEIPQNGKFAAIGWRKEKEGQLGIIDYYYGFSSDANNKNKIEYSTLVLCHRYNDG